MLALEQPMPIMNPQDGLREFAEERLRRNSYLALHNVSCDYQDGALILGGCLPSYFLKQVAQKTVAHLEEVTSIDNRIEVMTPHFRSRRS